MLLTYRGVSIRSLVAKRIEHVTWWQFKFVSAWSFGSRKAPEDGESEISIYVQEYVLRVDRVLAIVPS